MGEGKRDDARHGFSDGSQPVSGAYQGWRTAGECARCPFETSAICLSLHSKTSGGKTFLIFYDADGERQALTYAEFNARVHQAANFMV